MAPTAIDDEVPIHIPTKASSYPQPLKTSSVLDQYESFDVTPSIGREFPKANLVEWLNAPNADELIRDLAITISQRGVVFFRAQDNLTNELQKQLILRIGELSGRPAESGLHIHPVLNSDRELGGSDPEISTISSLQNKKYYRKFLERGGLSSKKQTTAQWHSDIAFEPVPADYSSLRLVQLPKTGGDTLWASGYEIYDRLSTPYQKFLESLTATFEQPGFAAVAEEAGFTLYDKPRGNPKNVGSILKAVHPVVRTNPVTGWKSVYPVGGHVKHINDVTAEESKHLLDWFLDLLQKNHEIQVRFRWQNPNDIAIWDNRSTFHTATFDYDEQGERFGNRAVGIGEAPYLDPNSKGRRESLGSFQAKNE
ncbi:TfdA family Taurine catabolism dioxygenase TauD [Colletotrichum graminicola]|nr:TfdA family Taurine catabolism dioxygenase TauD [Colletotrichum graminicola]